MCVHSYPGIFVTLAAIFQAFNLKVLVMAKNNMFLGFAKGSVGDVVFYRSQGKQISRARNRNPNNPRSPRQLVQRAVMASISRLYSLGRIIFDHAWQGEKVGIGSQQGFLRDNLPLLKSLVVSEINAGQAPDTSSARISAPRISVAVPFNGMKISNGDYSQQFFTRITQNNLSSWMAPAPAQGQTIAEYAAANGLVPGDIYTFLGIACGIMSDGNIMYDISQPDEDFTEYHRVYRSRLTYCQLKVKADIASMTDAISGSTRYSVLFDLYQGTSDLTNTAISDEISLTTLDDVYPAGVLGVIRSRQDTGVRSLSYAYFSGSDTFGLTPDVLLDAWRQESQSLAGSELILEGENF